MTLSRDAILKADDLKSEVVSVPEWGGDVRVRTLTALERDRWEAGVGAVEGQPNLRNVRARLAVLCCVDDAGQRLFTDDDAEALGAKSGDALDRIWEVAMRLNAMRKKDAEAVRKNSEAVPSADSLSV